MRKIVNGFEALGGKHCITTALRQVLAFYGVSISEEMLFGIGAGISFCYVNLNQGPMVSGRTKPFVFEQRIGERLGITLRGRSSGTYAMACKKTKKMIDQNKPVLVYVDMPYLEYLHLNEESHFGGHAVVIFGYDEEKGVFYISDRDQEDSPIRTPIGMVGADFHLVEFSQIEKARSSCHRPFPSKNKYLEVEVTRKPIITRQIIIDAVNEACDTMLSASAKLLGVNGIEKFSSEVRTWRNYDKEKLKHASVTNYFQISGDGGTGGGIFRKMYGMFLIESGKIAKIESFERIGEEFIQISFEWDCVAEQLWELSETLRVERLEEVSSLIYEIYKKEYELFSMLKEVVQI